MYAAALQLPKCPAAASRLGKRLVSYMLGIETSCDDTGIAIVDTTGRVHANVLESQQKFHTR